MLLATSRSFRLCEYGIVSLGVYDSDVEVLSRISVDCNYGLCCLLKPFANE